MDRDLEARIREAAAALRRGGLVAYPTETFYALGAVALDAAAVDRLVRVKGRPEGKPLPLLAHDIAAVSRVAVLTRAATLLAQRFWPGPLTLVLPARAGLPAAITAGTDTVGVRVPGSAIARALASEVGSPLVATSANVAGGPPSVQADALAPELRAQLDYVLDGGSTPGGRPSTVVEVEGESVRVLRPGPIAAEALALALRATGR